MNALNEASRLNDYKKKHVCFRNTNLRHTCCYNNYLIKFQNCEECFLRNFYRTNLFHSLLSLFLFFQ